MDGSGVAVHVEHTLTAGGMRRMPTLEQEVLVENRGDRPLRALLGVEWATTMLGGGGNPSAYWDLGSGERTAHDAYGTRSGVTELRSGNDYIGVEVATSVTPAAEAWHSPIETISNSEAGFERVYQGSALLLGWQVELAPGARTTIRVSHLVTTSRDRAQEEAIR